MFIKKQDTNREKISVKRITHTELISRIYKDLLQISKNMTNNIIDKSRCFKEKKIQLVNKHMGRFSTSLIMKEMRTEAGTQNREGHTGRCKQTDNAFTDVHFVSMLHKIYFTFIISYIEFENKNISFQENSYHIPKKQIRSQLQKVKDFKFPKQKLPAKFDVDAGFGWKPGRQDMQMNQARRQRIILYPGKWSRA